MGKGNKKKPNNPDPFTNVKTMAQSGKRMIKDMAFGKFNIYNEGHVFRNFDFVNAVIAEYNKYLLDINIHIAAIEYAYNGTEDLNVLRLLHRDKQTKEAYELIINTLSKIIYSGGDTGFLWILANRLPNYKYNI